MRGEERQPADCCPAERCVAVPARTRTLSHFPTCQGFYTSRSSTASAAHPAAGEWRVGCKHVYELVSRGLVARLKEERRRKWEEAQRRAIAEAVAALAK